VTSLVLVINSGSSSLKYQLIDADNDGVLLKGNVEQIGNTGRGFFADHEVALEHVLREIEAAEFSLSDIAVIGHRVVHGGRLFTAPTVVTPEVLAGIESLIPLAPLHNPANLVGIQALQELLPSTPQVAVFDTAFHATIPDFASTYAIDHEVAQSFGIKRYGFHGTSHQFVTEQLAKILNKSVSHTNAIICHIGNGASVTAVVGGKSVDTSMGMTPLEGLVMGTRSGDIDAGVLFHLARVGGYSIAALDELLNRKSGLMGLTGLSDMRAVREAAASGDELATRAREIYAYRIQKYVASYLGVVANLDAVVFTAGVGENDAELRSMVINPLSHLGFVVDEAANANRAVGNRTISDATSRFAVMVVGTNEEAEIARQSAAAIGR
jgi:acetate kinase